MTPKIEILPKVKEVLRAEADAINAVKIDSSYEEAINILFESSKFAIESYQVVYTYFDFKISILNLYSSY